MNIPPDVTQRLKSLKPLVDTSYPLLSEDGETVGITEQPKHEFILSVLDECERELRHLLKTYGKDVVQQAVLIVDQDDREKDGYTYLDNMLDAALKEEK